MQPGQDQPYESDDIYSEENGPYLVDGEPPEEPEYSEYDEELDDAHRFHVAMNVFDTVSVLIGLVVILLLVAMLVSLVSWLQSDVAHSLSVLQSSLQ